MRRFHSITPLLLTAGLTAAALATGCGSSDDATKGTGGSAGSAAGSPAGGSAGSTTAGGNGGTSPGGSAGTSGGGTSGGGTSGGGTSSGGTSSGGTSGGGTSSGGSGGSAQACSPANVFLGTSLASPTNDDANDVAFAADLNGDGVTDLVQAVTSSTNAFAVLLGKPGGTFAAPVLYQGNSSGYAVGALDVDGDGHLDVVYGGHDDSGTKGLYVAKGKGDGTFAAGKFADIGNYEVLGLKVADMNGDGKSDLVMPVQDNGSSGSATLVVVLTSGGTLGTATPSNDVPIGSGNDALAVGDLNGDGKPDVATYDTGKSLCVLINNNGAGLQKPVCYPASATLQTEAIAMGDVNGDGKNDLVGFNFDSAHGVDVLLNNGDGTFGSPTSYGLSQFSLGHGVLADMNNDGKLDLVGLNNNIYTVDSTLLIGFNKGDGTFTTPAEYFGFGSTAGNGELLVGNFVGNGLPAIASVTFLSNAAAGRRIDVLPASCRTTIPAPAPVLPAAGAPAKCAATLGSLVSTSGQTNARYLAAAADMDGDGKADLVTVGPGSGVAFTVALSNGDGTFKAAKSQSGPLTGDALAVGDVDGDGKVDVVYGSYIGSSSLGLTVSLNAGGGTFKAPVQTLIALDGTTPQRIELGDLNNDGHLDALVDGVLLLGRGDGTFGGVGVPTGFYSGDDSAHPFRFADVNGDKQLDVLSLSKSADGHYGVCVRLNTGSSNFGPPTCANVASYDSVFAFTDGDVNGDGKVDLVMAVQSKEQGIQVALGKGDGTFADLVFYPLPTQNPHAIEVVDYNNDGKLDVVAYDSVDSALYLSPGAGDGSFAGTVQTFGVQTDSSGQGVSLVVGDFRGNGLKGFGLYNPKKTGFDLILPTCSM